MNARPLIVGYLLVVWFVISFVTNLIGPLMPQIISDFRLKLGLAGFLPFSFFLAYGVVSIPAGVLVERAGAKSTLLIAFAVNVVGALLLALWPSYGAAVAALFIIGIGMAMLQVVINPLMRTAGGEAHFAFFSVLAQLVFGLASFLSPIAFTALMHRAKQTPGAALFTLVPASLPWIVFYWLFAALFMTVIAVTLALPLPRVALKNDERAGTLGVYRELARDPMVLRYFVGIASYVGTEQSLANWMSQFLSSYHGVSPLSGGATAVSWFWGLMSVGCVLGLPLLRLFDSRKVLGVFTFLAIVTVICALFGGRAMALAAFPLSGFLLSVMFSIVFSLALNSVPRHHGAFSGILCSGIIGGALAPLLVGMIGEHIGLRPALLITLATLGYIFGVSIWARPLIANATVTWTELWRRENAAGADH